MFATRYALTVDKYSASFNDELLYLLYGVYSISDAYKI